MYGLATFAECGNVAWRGRAAKAKGTIAWYQDRFDEALSWYERAEADLALTGMTVQAAFVDNPAEAVKLFEKARPVIASAGMETEAATIDVNSSIAPASLGRASDALALLDRAGEVFEPLGVRQKAGWVDYYRRMRRSLEEDRLKTSFVLDKTRVYDAAVSLAVELGRHDEALAFVERAKSQALLDSVRALGYELRAEHGEGQTGADKAQHAAPLAETSSGDELLGMSRAVFRAGASSLVASLWKVNHESTTALAVEFYSGLLRGRTKMEALRVRERPPQQRIAPDDSRRGRTPRGRKRGEPG